MSRSRDSIINEAQRGLNETRCREHSLREMSRRKSSTEHDQCCSFTSLLLLLPTVSYSMVKSLEAGVA